VVLGSWTAGSFVAKRELAKWPLSGLLARLQGSVFIERQGKRVAAHRDEMSIRLEAGDDLILFAEGTSGDGNRVLPFKSALFAAANARPAMSASTQASTRCSSAFMPSPSGPASTPGTAPDSRNSVTSSDISEPSTKWSQNT